MPVPTGRLAILVALASIVTVFVPMAQPGGMLVVLAVVVLIGLIDWALARNPAAVEIDRQFPPSIVLGSRAQLRWVVTNTTNASIRLGFADQLAPSLRAAARRHALTLPAKGIARIEAEVHPERRGRFDIDDLSVRTFGPLGLFAKQRNRVQPQLLRVLPQYRSKDEAELRVKKARLLEVGLRSAKGRGGGTEFDQLREYTTDDEFRRVDWAATARLGKPIVRDYRAERNQTVINLLDNGRTMAGRVADVPRVEHAMDAVMALTTVATRLGDKCGLLAFDRQVRAVVPPGRGSHQLGLVTEAMYDLEPVLLESDYRSAFTETLVRFRRRSMLVIHTELSAQSVGENLLPALPLIARNHVVIVAAVRDPDVQSWSSDAPDAWPDVYRQAAALDALAERQRTIARLRAFGAVVLDEPPGDLAPRLADAYLRVKAVGRL